MKTVGLIGGMSWESSAEYYRLLNELVKARLGGLHSAKSVMVSVDFAEIELLQVAGRWHDAGAALAQAARDCERAGADCLLLATNTMHRVADAIQAAVEIPLIHIADATAVRAQAANLERVGLLGTRFTMEQDFYKGRLIHEYGLDVLIPDDKGREAVHSIIYEELVLGDTKDESREIYQRIIGDLVEAGAQGVILGCTEIPLLIKPKHSPVPVLDTTLIHVEAAVDFALDGYSVDTMP